MTEDTLTVDEFVNDIVGGIVGAVVAAAVIGRSPDKPFTLYLYTESYIHS